MTQGPGFCPVSAFPDLKPPCWCLRPSFPLGHWDWRAGTRQGKPLLPFSLEAGSFLIELWVGEPPNCRLATEPLGSMGGGARQPSTPSCSPCAYPQSGSHTNCQLPSPLLRQEIEASGKRLHCLPFTCTQLCLPLSLLFQGMSVLHPCFPLPLPLSRPPISFQTFIIIYGPSLLFSAKRLPFTGFFPFKWVSHILNTFPWVPHLRVFWSTWRFH